MNSSKELDLITPRRIAYYSSILVLILPVFSLIGWISQYSILASLSKEFIPMAPSTAICVLLLSLSLIALLRKSLNRSVTTGIYVAGSVVSLYGLSTFIGNQSGLPIAPDNLILPFMGMLNGTPLGRMASATGFLIFLSGTSILATVATYNRNKFSHRLNRWAGLCGIAVLLFGLFFILGYALDSPLFYGENSIPVALTTSITFVFLGIGLVTISNLNGDIFDKPISKMRDIKIGTQLRIGFSVVLIFVIILSIVASLQNVRIYQQTEIMYEHPLQVRRAIGALEADILRMRLGTRDLMMAVNNKERQDAIQLMELSSEDAVREFNILREQYLGPREDVDEAYKAFLIWKISREENTKLAISGELDKVKESVSSSGEVGIYRDKMLAKIKKIDTFAKNKAEALMKASEGLKNLLIRQLIILAATILLLSLIINYVILRNIRKPIFELTGVAHRFRNGDMNARSTYSSQNEFGVLSDSFNSLAENIQINLDLSQKAADLSGLMLGEDDANKFFRTTLNGLSAQTGSVMSAVYLLNEEKKHFEHFESIGVNDNARQSFAADNFEGEFGSVLSSRKVQHVKNISDNTRFVFNTVSGNFIPCEIITIPILASNEVIAIISLASVTSYSKHSLQLIDNILDTLSARVEGILAYRKMKYFSKTLELQNRELESQKSELASQSSELMEQNAELEMQKKELDESSRLKTSFLSNMSHELRTPLNSVIALSGVLSRRLVNQVPEEEYSYLQVIERNGKHLLSLINDILDISRIEAGREEIEITKFNANNLVAEVISMIQPQAQQKNIELLQTGNASGLFITSDDGKCRHILQNLIGNAVKFTESGKVEIAAQQNGKNIEIIITDTGIGISETNLSHIFDEFRQADGSTSRRFGGTGLGLAIAKKYANMLGGTITVNSVLGKGSEFKLKLPLRYASENRIIETEATANFRGSIAPGQHKQVPITSLKTILLVEDSEPAIIQMKDIMEENGYQILVARDGRESLKILTETIPDAMILDLMMPGIDGFEVLRSIREVERTAHIPVLILTAKHITKEELKFLKRNNVHQLIQKGDVNRDELLNAVAGMVFKQEEERVKPKHEFRTINGKPVVLIVEDNPDNMITAKALLADNYTVLEAKDGVEGIELARKHQPHLILMDIGLPVMDGVEAFKSIRKLKELQHIPVIALTASAMSNDREAILAYGFDAYIAKPIDELLFFKTINETLHGK